MTRLEELQEKAAKIAQQIKIERAKTRLTCKNKHCGRRFPVSKLTYFQVRCYEEPSGCSGGDYYYDASSCLWQCPKCEYYNRLHGGQYEKAERKAEYDQAHGLKYLFKEVREVEINSGGGYVIKPKD